MPVQVQFEEQHHSIGIQKNTIRSVYFDMSKCIFHYFTP